LAWYDGNAWQYPIEEAGFHGTTARSGSIVYLDGAQAAAAGRDGALFLATSTSVCIVKDGEMPPAGYPEHKQELSGKVLAMLVDPEGNLYAGGEGQRIGNSGPTVTIARWDGRRWSLLESASRRFLRRIGPPSANFRPGSSCPKACRGIGSAPSRRVPTANSTWRGISGSPRAMNS
jgi:hypothetical protein